MATQGILNGAKVARGNLHALTGAFRTFAALFMMKNGRYLLNAPWSSGDLEAKLWVRHGGVNNVVK